MSSRLDENDAVFILDKVLIPWENVFVYGDVEKANNFFPRTGFLPRFVVHGCTRLAVKLDFIAGLLLKAIEVAGTKDFRGVQANVGEVIAWRNLFWALSDAMVRDPKPWIGDYLLPNIDPGSAYAHHRDDGLHQGQVHHRADGRIRPDLSQFACARFQESGNPALSRQVSARLERLRGRRAGEAAQAAMGLSIGSEFGGRHELYEINYGGSTEEIRRYCLFGAMASGNADKFKGFAEQCMAEYDLDGWKVPDLMNPDDLSYHVIRSAVPCRPEAGNLRSRALRCRSAP